MILKDGATGASYYDRPNFDQPTPRLTVQYASNIQRNYNVYCLVKWLINERLT